MTPEDNPETSETKPSVNQASVSAPLSSSSSAVQETERLNKQLRQMSLKVSEEGGKKKIAFAVGLCLRDRGESDPSRT